MVVTLFLILKTGTSNFTPYLGTVYQRTCLLARNRKRPAGFSEGKFSPIPFGQRPQSGTTCLYSGFHHATLYERDEGTSRAGYILA